MEKQSIMFINSGKLCMYMGMRYRGAIQQSQVSKKRNGRGKGVAMGWYRV